MATDPSHSRFGGSPEDRLDSWKEIASYLNRDVRTVQRWEMREGLPVHRIRHRLRSSVFALKEEVNQWLEQRDGGSEKESSAGPFDRVVHVWGWIGPYVGLGCVILSVMFWDHLHFLHFEVLKPRPQDLVITTHMGHEIHPTLSPEGEFVAYSWDGGTGKNDDIYIEQVGSGHPLQRTTDPSRDYSPCWSPQGGQIAFLRTRDAEFSEIILISPLSGSERVLGTVKPPPWTWGPQLAWSGDEEWLITANRRPSHETYALYAIHIPSGDNHFITDPPVALLGDHSPAYSPTGDSVAFIRSVAGEIADVYVLGVDSQLIADGAPVKVTEIAGEISGPTWTATGKRIIFSAGNWPKAELWRTDPTPGSRADPLPLAGEGVYYPRITSKQHLVFSRIKSSVNIWEIETETGHSRKSGFSSSEIDTLPEYSPDGSRIAFTSNRTGYPELWIHDEDEVMQWTNFKASHTGHVSWSPDGGRLAFDSTLFGTSDIFILPVQASAVQRPSDSLIPNGAVRLTSHPSSDIFAEWSPSGDHVYFSSKRTGNFELWRVAVEGGNPEQVTDSGGYFLKVSPERGSIFFSKWQQAGLWEKNLETGAVSQVMKNYVDRFAVSKNGIYFVLSNSNNHDYQIRFWSFETGETSEVFFDTSRLADGWTVAKDGRRLLLSKYDLEGADLVLIDAFSCRRLVGLSLFPLVLER